jgi:iron(III) transport system ATP-binding protein
MYVQLENIVKTYDQSVAVDDLTLDIEQGEFLVLLGPSGCGKTTTMRALVGLEEPTSGRISVGGQVLFDRTKGINVPSNQRGMGMVFQSYAIWPHMTVFQNVSYPLEMQRLSRAETRCRVEEMLELVGLGGLGPRGASQLSGGQMQRVALARSLVMRPKVLLLDEPLSNLDAKLRDKLRFELRAIQQELGTTSVYVTHDQAEALALADRIAVMDAGRIRQVVQLEAPTELYRRPANTFVADFLGASNLLRGFVRRKNGDAPHVRLADSPLCLPIAADDTTPADGSATHLSIRPEVVDLLDASAEIRPGRLPAVVKVASFLGTHVRYHVQLVDGPDMYVMSHDTERLLKAGSPAVVSVPPSSIQVLAE